jgi:ribosomal protein L37E
MKCRKCGYKPKNNVNFCPRCGAPIPERIKAKTQRKTCPRCGEIVSAQTKFCVKCGYQFENNIRGIEDQKKKSKVLMIIGIMLIIVFIAMIIVSGILFLKMKDGEENETTVETKVGLIQVEKEEQDVSEKQSENKDDSDLKVNTVDKDVTKNISEVEGVSLETLKNDTVLQVSEYENLIV